jgi:hypothetical protein
MQNHLWRDLSDYAPVNGSTHLGTFYKIIRNHRL